MISIFLTIYIKKDAEGSEDADERGCGYLGSQGRVPYDVLDLGLQG